MELHTFSSLTKDFLPQYNGAMEKADVAIVYYNPDVLHAKHLAEFTPADVSAAFAQDGLVVLQSSADVEAAVRREATPGCVLLLMSSGDFGGIDIKALVTDLSR